MIHPWPLIQSSEIFDAGLFQVAKDTARSPRHGHESNFLVVRIPDFVLVVGLTKARELVLVRQYRHGVRAMSLEIPGGLHDGDGETPEQGAARELREETGYGGGCWRLLGPVKPQPAMQSNRAWIFFASDLELQAATQFDHTEDIETELVSLSRLPEFIADGRIDNALTLAGLALAQMSGHLAVR